MTDTQTPDTSQSTEEIGARHARLSEDLRTAVGSFLADFAWFESMYLSQALNGLSNDQTLVDCLVEVADLSSRLKLLKLVAEAKRLPKPLLDDISKIRGIARRCIEFRNEIAHNGPALLGNLFDGPNLEPMAGVLRPQSKRAALDGDRLPTKESLRAMHATWINDLTAIRQWHLVVKRLSEATMILGDKLARHHRNETWESIAVPDVAPPASPKPPKTPESKSKQKAGS